MLDHTSKNGILTYTNLYGTNYQMELAFQPMTGAWGDFEEPQDVKPTPKQEHCLGVRMLFAHQEVEDMKPVLEDLRAYLKQLEDDQSFPKVGESPKATHDEAIDYVKRDIDFYEDVIHDMTKKFNKLYKEFNSTKLNELKDQRAAIRQRMDELYVKQKEHYVLQKERFETCKQTYGRNHTMFFPEQDQEFISNHRAANEACKNEWAILCDQASMLTQEIDKIDPDDMDY